MTAPAADTRPFAPFEWMLALRYLRARRKEGFISVIAGFSFLGILLGVATLIIVMAVMNGFRKELFNKILGLDGHVVVHKIGADDFPDYEEVAQRLEAVPGVKHALPLIEGQVIASTPVQALGAKVRGLSEDGHARRCRSSPTMCAPARSTASTARRASPSACALPTPARQRRRQRHADLAARRHARPSAPRRASSPTRWPRSSRWACRSSTAA